MLIAKIVAILFVVWLLLVLLPAWVCYRYLFTRKKPLPIDSTKKGDDDIVFHKTLEAMEWLKNESHQTVTMRNQDGLLLYADYYDRGYESTVLMMHGYRTSPMKNFAYLSKYFIDQEFNLLIVDERTHGRSEGKYCTLGIKESNDVLQWISWIESNTATNKILLYGISMGCASLYYAARKITSEKVRGIIFDCGFSSPYKAVVYDVSKRHVPYQIIMPYIIFFGRAILKVDIRVNNYDSLQQSNIPAVFVHGDMDTTIPYQETEKAYAVYHGKKEIMIAKGAIHTTSFIADEEHVKPVFNQFIRDNFKDDLS